MKVITEKIPNRKMGLVFLLLFSGCLADDRSFRNLAPASESVQVQFSHSDFVFYQGVPGAMFMDKNGVEISRAVAAQNTERVDELQLTVSSRKLLKVAQKLKESWLARGGKKISVQVATNTGHLSIQYVEMKTVEIGLKLPRCHDARGKYKLGCAVNSNRALSLVTYNELQKGSELGRGRSALESRSINALTQSKSVKFQGAVK
ncbi:MAG: hypothetical protein V7727_00530 [Sneathiella sp.]